VPTKYQRWDPRQPIRSYGLCNCKTRANLRCWARGCLSTATKGSCRTACCARRTMLCSSMRSPNSPLLTYAPATPRLYSSSFDPFFLPCVVRSFVCTLTCARLSTEHTARAEVCAHRLSGARRRVSPSARPRLPDARRVRHQFRFDIPIRFSRPRSIVRTLFDTIIAA
jgi:hypothetical protein